MLLRVGKWLLGMEGLESGGSVFEKHLEGGDNRSATSCFDELRSMRASSSPAWRAEEEAMA